MRITFKSVRRLGVVLLITTGLIGVVIWNWVIPRAIVAAIRERYDGDVTIGGWWINGSSAGVTGLTLRETINPSSPAWLTTDWVSTDLNLWGLFHGRLAPRRIVLAHPSIQYRIDANGQPLTQIVLRHSGSGPIPEFVVENGQLEMRQADRPEMRINHIAARLAPEASGPRFEVRSDDPDWGHPAIDGRFSPDFAGVELRLTADRLNADRAKADQIPFVVKSAWTFFEPHGPIGVVLDYSHSGKEGDSPSLKTVVTLQKTRVALPYLGLIGDDATGRVTIQDQTVSLDDVRGQLGGGQAGVSGTLDFSKPSVRYRLTLEANELDLAALPASWQLDRTGVKGRLSGTAAMRMILTPRGLDLTGSTGSGRIDGATVEGIPLQQIRMTLRSEGPRAVGESVAASDSPFLPQWIGGDFQVQNVALDKALAHLGSNSVGESREVEISGRLALNARARFPFGSLDDVKAYTAQGTADLSDASISGLDLGRLEGRLDLRDGVLEITHLRGRLTDRPVGRAPIPPADLPPAEGPLTPGGFRARVRADLVTDPMIKVDLEGVELPIGELLKPASVAVSGRFTIQATAEARGRGLSDPRVWKLSGNARMPEASYKRSTIRDLSTAISIADGRLVLTDVSAKLGDAPLKGRLGIDLKAPWAYESELETGVLPLNNLLPWLPHVPEDFPVSGTVAGRGVFRGTVRPLRIETSGEARVVQFQAGRVPVGDMPIRWSTQGEAILLVADEVQRYGGEIKAEARMPVQGDRPIEGTITLARVDTTELSATAPQSWKLAGRADGQVRFRLRPGSGGNVPDLDADGQLSAADLTIRGIPSQVVDVTMKVRQGVPSFQVQAETLGGSVRLTGDARIGSDPKDDQIHAEVKALAVQLYKIWDVLGTTGGLTQLRGRGLLTGELQTHAHLKDVRLRAEADLDELTWGYNYALGRVRANLSAAPEGWRIGPLGGELWGSPVHGEGIIMDRLENGKMRYGVDVRLDRISLSRGLAFWPEGDRRFGGFGSLKVMGKSDDSLRGTAEMRIERGTVNGLELTDFRAPADWSLMLEGTPRGALQVRKAVGKLAGGTVGGDAWIALGSRRDFRAKLFVDDVDLRVISRDEMANRSMPGRISGFLTLSGLDPLQPASYRGELDFDLVQASIGDIPLLDELDRSLGSARGGIFDQGDFHGVIADQKVRIDHLTLVGPLAQIHASGTLDFDGRLNLEVVANTNKGIPQTGQAILAQSPNVAEAVARRAAALDQVADFVSARLMKFRITGSIRDPIVNVDQSINARGAIGFFLRATSLSIQSPSRGDSRPR